MAQLIRGLDARRVADNLARVRAEIGDEIEVLAAVKYVAAEEMGVLAEAGVGVTEVHDCGLCTACDEERFFSHRRDRGLTGRQAGLAWRS
jgi:copper oxidase (laccase) domain-containing protein